MLSLVFVVAFSVNKALSDTSNGVSIEVSTSSSIASWSGWGAGIYNNRSAGSDAVVSTSNFESVSEICSTRYEPGVSAAPLIEGDIAYYTTWTGLLVAQKYKSCHTIWTTNVTKITLGAGPLTHNQNISTISPVSRSTPVTDGEYLFLATVQNSLVLAVQKSDGSLVSTLQVDKHELAIITGSPTLYNGIIYVGVSSLEVAAAALVPGYKCCSLVGTMNGISFKNKTLSLLWSKETMTQPKNVTGAAFSGASIWGSQPAIDTARKQVIIGTGNTHSVPDEFIACQNETQNIEVVKQGLVSDPCLPPNIYQDSIVAYDLETGRVNWATQLSGIDDWNSACVAGNSTNCPPFAGPDGDFGMAPTFVPGSAHTPDGIDIVVAGQKNGYLFALSAQSGFIKWARQVSPVGLAGGLSWGIAVDHTAAYYTAINTAGSDFTFDNGKTVNNSFFGAQSLKDGSTIWQTAAPNGRRSQVTPTVTNGLILTGTSGTGPASGGLGLVGSGSLVALSKKTGQVIKETVFDDYFQGGIAVVKDYIVFGTGYKAASEPGSMHVWKV